MFVKRRERDEMELDALRAEANARRLRLAGNIDELSVRMRPGNLVQEAKNRAWAEVDRVTDEVLNIAEDFVNDSVAWVQGNRTAVIGGGLTALAAAGLMWFATRKKPIPLYAAYDMEDPLMTDSDETLSAKAASAWDKVKDEAVHLAEKAEGGYYAARSRAADLSADAKERAAEAAAVAKVKAHEAAEAARDAAEKARIAAGEAGEWAKKQPQENPATVILVALAAGALIGSLLPSGGRRRA